MKKQGSVTITLDEKAQRKMMEFYSLSPNEEEGNPVLGRKKEEGVAITIYKRNKKGEIKALFQGENALYEARIWDKDAKLNEGKSQQESENEPSVFLNLYPQIGSDEVGTGDFFGPIVVAAAYIEKNDLPYIEEIGIRDSKKMGDERILALGPSLIKRFDYSELSLDNERFNEESVSKFNMNEIKAKMHNKALLNLSKRHPGASLYQDQFAKESLYYKYLQNEKEVAKGIVFKTKGESAFPSVALASVIARYAFLRKMAKMGERYGLSFPFGAGKEVESFARAFVEKYGEEEMKKVAKMSFATYKKISNPGS